MSKLISARSAAVALVIIFILASLYHLAALAGVIPIDMVWGGRLTSRSELVRFEGVALVINLCMMAVVFIKMKVMHQPARIINGLLWLMVILFTLNTLGNLVAMNSLEAILFTPVTLISAVLCLRLARNKSATS